MPEFYTGDNSYNPEYSGINWSEMARNLGRQAEKAIWFRESELEIQCTQENTQVYMSKVHDDSDAILVRDPRDNAYFSFFRDQFEEDAFDRTTTALQQLGACSLHFSLYPVPRIFEIWQNKLLQDNTVGDTVPREWLGEVAD